MFGQHDTSLSLSLSGGSKAKKTHLEDPADELKLRSNVAAAGLSLELHGYLLDDSAELLEE